jgi:thiamine-monophosphate kinase
MEKGQNRTELSALGEFKLIDRLTSDVNIYNSTTIKGVGDDAAVIDLGDEYQVITTDMLLEGVHFDLSYVPLRHLGYKSVAVNAVEALDEIYAGIKIACENYNVDLVGGDTTTSRSGLVISITALGRVPKDKIAYRSRAKKGDIICVTGDLGGAYMGLQVLEREKQVFLSNPEVQPELTGKDYIIQRQLKPEARMDLIYELRDLGVIPTAMIDVSDGLASEILHLCRNSKVGARVYEEKIPIHGETYNTAAEFNLSPTTVALNGGEDYELLFTINQADFEKIKHQPDISYIGYISENENEAQLITKSGNVATLTAQGWTHF